jgi:hypothetical protein
MLCNSAIRGEDEALWLCWKKASWLGRGTRWTRSSWLSTRLNWLIGVSTDWILRREGGSTQSQWTWLFELHRREEERVLSEEAVSLLENQQH